MVQSISRMKLILCWIAKSQQFLQLHDLLFVLSLKHQPPISVSFSGCQIPVLQVDVKHPEDLAMTLNSQASFSTIAPGALCRFSTSQSGSNLESPPNKKNFTFWQKNKQQRCLPHLYFLFFSSFFSDVSPLAVKPIQFQCRWSSSRAHKHTLPQSKCQCYGTWKESASLPNLTAFIIY